MFHLFTGASKVPKPISAEEEPQLIKAIKEGNDAMREQARATKRLWELSIKVIMKKMTKKEQDEETSKIFSNAFLKLQEMLRDGKYEYRKGKGILSFFFWLIHDEIRNHYKALKRAQTNLANYALNNPPQKSMEAPQELQLFAEMDRTRVFRALDKLKGNCKDILGFYYIDEMSLSDIAIRLDLAPISLSTLKMRCLKKLRKQYELMLDLHLL